MQNQPASSNKASKLTVLLVVAIIVVGVAIWTSVSIKGLDQPDPEIAQDYAKLFQRRCLRDVSNEKTCLDTIAYHHRRCFSETTVQERPEEWGSAYIYDKDAYLQCMRTNIATP